MNESPYCIAYLGRVLPVLSETFVVREIAALRSLGVRIKPFRLYPPGQKAIHPEAPGLAREVKVLCRPTNPLFWLAADGWQLVSSEFNSRRSAARMLELFAAAINSRQKFAENQKLKTENWH
jgi:hypothetical protein